MGEVAERKVHKIMFLFINMARIKLECCNYISIIIALLFNKVFPYLKLGVVLINNGTHFLNVCPMYCILFFPFFVCR